MKKSIIQRNPSPHKRDIFSIFDLHLYNPFRLSAGYLIRPEMVLDRPTFVRNSDSRDNDFKFPCCVAEQLCHSFSTVLNWPFPTFLGAISKSCSTCSIDCYLKLFIGLTRSLIYRKEMADEFPIPETQVLAVASHVGQPLRDPSFIRPTDIVQGCLWVSTTVLELGPSSTKKHAGSAMSATRWRRL